MPSPQREPKCGFVRRKPFGFHSEVVKFLKRSRLFDSLMIDLSEAHSMIFIDDPSPELSLGVDSNSEVVTDREINDI